VPAFLTCLKPLDKFHSTRVFKDEGCHLKRNAVFALICFVLVLVPLESHNFTMLDRPKAVKWSLPVKLALPRYTLSS